MWYDNSRLLSYNKILNFIISNRGDGKTYNAKDWCIRDFKKNKKQFVWVRRYKEELKKKGKFFDDIKEKYPNDKLEVKGYTALINDEIAGYFIPLSTSKIEKSTSYPNVNKIIFDEFIIDKGVMHYLPNEVELFLDLVETIQRIRDDVRVELIANNVTVVNPYFMFFKLKLDSNKRFNVFDEIVVEYYTDDDFINKKKQTRFGRLVAGTKYEEFAIENKPLRDNEIFIAKKTPKSDFMLAIKYNNRYYGFWVDYKEGLVFVNEQYDPSSYSLYALNKDDHEPNLLLIKSLKKGTQLQRIIYCFENGLIRFENMQVKNQFYEFIGYFVR